MEPVKRLADSAEELAAKYGSDTPAESFAEAAASDAAETKLTEKAERVLDTEEIEKIFALKKEQAAAERAEWPEEEIAGAAEGVEEPTLVYTKPEPFEYAEEPAFEPGPEIEGPAADVISDISDIFDEPAAEATPEPAEIIEEPAAEVISDASEIINEPAAEAEPGPAEVAEGLAAAAMIPEAAEGIEEQAAEAIPAASEIIEESAAEAEPEFAEAAEEPAAEQAEEPETAPEPVEAAEDAQAEEQSAAEGSENRTAAGRAEKNAKKKKKMHPLVKVLIALLIIVVLAGAAVGIATYTHYLVWMEEGPMIANKEDLTMQLNAEDLEKLGYFKDLKHVDLSGSPAGFEAVKAWADAHPNVDVDYLVEIPENATFDASTGLVDFTKLDAASAIAEIEGVQKLLKGRTVRIDPDSWTADDIEAFCGKLTRFDLEKGKKTFRNADVDTIRRFMAAVPDFEFDGTVALDNIEASITETNMDFTELSDAGLEELDRFLNVLPVYTDIDLGQEFAHDRLPTIYSFYEKHPEIMVRYEFGVLGQRHDINDTILDFNHIYMRDQGAEVREVISCMPKLRILDMDWCLVDNAHMEAIRNDFPNVDVEWRLWFPSNKYYSVRTDAKKIFLSAFGGGMLTNADCEQLKYCTKVKYMDIGHNEPLSDASFLAYMPELEVLVLSINLIDDISGLANCPHLEYMEMFNTHITNLDALENCKELKHLNICQNPYLKDISGVYGLSGLERFWVGDAWSTGVPREQVEQFKELNPDTLTCDYTYGAHTAGWRTGERYALLWKQMGYGEEDSEYSYYWLDPENPSHPWWTKYTAENGYTEENGYYNKYPVLQTGMWF